MESNQSSNIPNEEAVIELLTLTCEINEYGTKTYFNREGELHRIHGPAEVTKRGSIFWYRNGKLHREDGPAVTYIAQEEYYYINNEQLSKEEFILWQIENGIKPIK